MAAGDVTQTAGKALDQNLSIGSNVEDLPVGFRHIHCGDRALYGIAHEAERT
jgi:hypothetical protein